MYLPLLMLFIIKTEYVIHRRNLKQTLNHKLELKKIHRAIKFNQKSWLKPYTNMNWPKKSSKKWFLKIFLSYMDTDSFIVYIKTDDIYKDIAKDVEQGLILQIMN